MSCAVAVGFPPAGISSLEMACHLRGYTVTETTAAVCASLGLPAGDEEAAAFVAREVADNAVALEGAEAYLGDPRALVSGTASPVLALRAEAARAFVAAAYAPSAPVTRSLLGRLLTSRVRARLDLVAERSGVRAAAAARTFDCLRRVLDACTDAEWRLPVLATLAGRFALPPRLAWQYACLMLLLRARVTVNADTRLDALSLAALEDVTGAALVAWAPSAVAAAAPADAPFVAVLRELRRAGDSPESVTAAALVASGQSDAASEAAIGLGLDADGFLAPLRAFISADDLRRTALADAAAAALVAGNVPRPVSAMRTPVLQSLAGGEAASGTSIAVDGRALDSAVAALCSLCTNFDATFDGEFFSRVFDVLVLPLRGAGFSRAQAASVITALGAAAAAGGVPPDQAAAWRRYVAVVEVTGALLWQHCL